MKLLISTFILFAIFYNPIICQNKSNSLSEIEWLLGEWVVNSEKTKTIEKWEKLSLNSFEGFSKSYSIKNDSLVFGESLRILLMNNEIYYLAKVNHNNLPIAFQLESLTDNKAIFRNKNHDFPKEIIYELVDENHLTVKVSNEKRNFSVNYEKNK